MSAAKKSASSASRFARAAASRRTTQQESSPDRGHTAVRSKPLRTTVDLSPSDHRRLRRIADRLAEELDVPEVSRRAVWLALLAELAEDEDLYTRVRDRVRDSRDDVDTA